MVETGNWNLQVALFLQHKDTMLFEQITCECEETLLTPTVALPLEYWASVSTFGNSAWICLCDTSQYSTVCKEMQFPTKHYYVEQRLVHANGGALVSGKWIESDVRLP